MLSQHNGHPNSSRFCCRSTDLRLRRSPAIQLGGVRIKDQDAGVGECGEVQYPDQTMRHPGFQVLLMKLLTVNAIDTAQCTIMPGRGVQLATERAVILQPEHLEEQPRWRFSAAGIAQVDDGLGAEMRCADFPALAVVTRVEAQPLHHHLGRLA